MLDRVLVLDSDCFACTGLRVQLAGHGYDVVHAEHAELGLEVVRTQRLCAAILELQVPRAAGARRERLASAFDLIRDMRMIAPGLAVVILTHDGGHLEGFLALMRAGVRGIAYKLKGLSAEQLAHTLGRIRAGQTEIDPDVVSQAHDLAEHLVQQLTPEEAPWVERALETLPQLTRQEARAARLLAASHNLAGIAQRLAIQRADTLVGRVYVKLGLDDLPRQAGHLRQNSILIKATQINDCRAAGLTVVSQAMVQSA